VFFAGCELAVLTQPNGRFNLYAPDGRCLQNTGALGDTCTDFFTLKRENGTREIRWGQSASDYPWSYDGDNFPATPCFAARELQPQATTAATYMEANCPYKRGVAGWDLQLPPESAAYGLGDFNKADPRIGLLLVLSQKMNKFSVRGLTIKTRIAGGVRGTNEDENDGMLRPALFGIHACEDYRSLVGGSCR
jgi:hypothetical protein